MTLDVCSLSFSHGASPVLDGLTFRVQSGQCLALLGVNGAGKSTLLKCLAGTLPLNAGHILLDKADLGKLPPKRRAQKVAYMPQHPQLPETTVLEAVLMGRIPHFSWQPSQLDLAVAAGILTELELDHLAMRTASALSGGEQQLVALARALAQTPDVLLCDEPTSSLDLKSQLKVCSLLRQLARQKQLIVIAALHDLNQAIRFADRFIFLKSHRILADGPESIVEKELIQAVYGIDADVITAANHPRTVIPC